MSDPKIESTQQLTVAMLSEIPEDVLEDLYLDDRDDNNLVDADFVKCVVSYKNKNYILIHGFPGDNASGVLYEDNTNFRVYLGEGCNESPSGDLEKEIAQWYIKIIDVTGEDTYPPSLFA